MAAPLDDLDETIVRTLMADGRLSIPALAEKVGTSRATAYARFDRLVDEGIISGFQAVVTPEVLGLTVAALVLIDANQAEWEGMADRIRALAGVQWVGLAAGRFDFSVLVRAEDLTDLRDVVLHELQRLEGVRSTETTVLLDEYGSLG